MGSLRPRLIVPPSLLLTLTYKETGARWDGDTMGREETGLGHNEIVAKRDCGTMGREHNWTGTQWDRDTIGRGHNGTGTQ